MPVERAFDGEADVGQAALPLQQSIVIRHLERKVMCASEAGMALGGVRPLEKRNGRAGLPGLVPEIQMIAARIVKVHGLLHEPLAEHARIEIHRALGVGADEGDVVQAKDGHEGLFVIRGSAFLWSFFGLQLCHE